jgi:hypothetical protein
MNGRVPAHIHVHIDRLVIDGVTPERRAEVAKQLRGELARLLADPEVAGGLRQGRNVASAPPVTLHAAEDGLGASAAEAIIAELRR